MNEKKSHIIKAFDGIGITISDKQAEQFLSYYELLVEWNGKMNLTAIDEREEVYEKHFFDSILPLNDSIQGKVADVGTGAGFPGVVWKIVRKDLEVSLRLYFASFAACASNLHAY